MGQTEEARTVGLGQYDLDRRGGGYVGVTENDLRHIMGFNKRESYEDTDLTAVEAHKARRGDFLRQREVIRKAKLRKAGRLTRQTREGYK